MNIYKHRIKFFAFFHISTLILTGVISTDQLYSKYKECRPIEVLEKTFTFLYNPISQRYYRITGTETGFGFFAPNVKSNGFLLPEVNNSAQDFSLLTNEGNSRFSTVISNSTDYLTSRTPSGNLSIEKYNELVIKNLALSYMSRTANQSDSIKLSYYILDYPFLNTIKRNEKINPQLIKIHSWTYGINK